LDEEGNSLAQIAIKQGNDKVIQILLEAGLDAHYDTGTESGTALSVANKNGYDDIVSLLIFAGAETERDDEITDIYSACAAGKVDIVKQMIEQGVDLNYINPTFSTPLLSAVMAGQAAVISKSKLAI
jgi:ankyrin repeat protein